MTLEQEQLVTLLFLKHGGFENLIGLWLHRDENLSAEEVSAIDAWMIVDDNGKPLNTQLHTEPTFQFLTAEIPLNKD